MAEYKLRYSHPYFKEVGQDDHVLCVLDKEVVFSQSTDEEAIKVAEGYRGPTGEKWYPKLGGPQEDLIQEPVELTKLVKSWTGG